MPHVDSLSSRRVFLFRGSVALALVACSGRRAPAICTDTAGLSKEEVENRERVAYVDRTPDPFRSCAKCTQFVPAPKSDACGGCRAFQGPVSPLGTCKIFALKG